jgi:outer membrane protein assembly factor BamB
MNECHLLKTELILGIVIIFIISSFSQITIGNTSVVFILDDMDNYEDIINYIPWPMHGYNREHIGRSPYSTADNPGIEKWRFPAEDCCFGSPVIGNDGTIFFGGGVLDRHLYAVNSDGTLKWKFKSAGTLGNLGSSPAIADDGSIYVGTVFGSYIQGINSNGTEKWKHWTSQIDTSITLDDEGSLYFGAGNNLEVRYPNNGSIKWKYSTNGHVMSTPAIDKNGTIYFGSHDKYIHALSQNGTLKWKFKTGDWVHGSPTIGTDGTVYCGSDDGYLYSLYPNGTLKWQCEVGSMLASPSLDKKGNLYFGIWESKICSVSSNGSLRWTYNLRDGDSVWGPTIAISDDDTIYVGNGIDYWILGGGEIIALDIHGNLKWRKIIADLSCESSPVIDNEGNVYICSSQSGGGPDAWGYLHCFGAQENNNPPSIPTITGPDEVKVRDWRTFKFKSSDEDNNPISFYIDWGDGNEGWTRDYEPNLTVPINHRWNIIGNYKIKAKARDTFGAESDWGYFKVTVPKSYILDYYGFLERFPLLQGFLI